MIVLKFGGTSVGSAQRIRSVAHLVATVPGRKIITLSAMSGTTDTLVRIAGKIRDGQWNDAADLVTALRSRYHNVVEELFEEEELQERTIAALTPIFEELLAQTHNEAFTLNDEKFILSRGEIMSTTLMAFTLRRYEDVEAVHLDALSFMRINHAGEPEPIYIRPYLYFLRIGSFANQSGCVIASSSS